MPRGRLRCGSRVSSAVVATTSNPMNAKNTSAAPDRTPTMPYIDGSRPVTNANSGWCRPDALSAGCAGGMNGEKFSALT